MKKILKTECYICKKIKECHSMFIYDKEEGYQNVYVCLKCYKKETK